MQKDDIALLGRAEGRDHLVEAYARLEFVVKAILGDVESGRFDHWNVVGPSRCSDVHLRIRMSGCNQLEAKAQRAATARGVTKDRIHIERFLAGRPTAALAAQIAQLQEKAAGLMLSVTLDGRTRKVEFTEANILDSAREAGLPAPFACKAGVCATCRAKVTKGKVEMAARYGLTDEEIAAGYVLTCQSVPVGEGVAVDYDA